MKKLLKLVLTLVIAFTATQVKAQYAIKINPLSLAFLTGNVQAEFKTKDAQSFQAGVMYSGVKLGDFKYTGFGLTPEYRFYLKGEALTGFYAGPYLRFQSFTVKESINFSGFTYDAKTNLTRIGGGGVFGYQYLSKGGFVFDVFLGLAYMSNSASSKVESNVPGLTYTYKPSGAFADGVSARFGIALGFGSLK